MTAIMTVVAGLGMVMAAQTAFRRWMDYFGMAASNVWFTEI